MRSLCDGRSRSFVFLVLLVPLVVKRFNFVEQRLWPQVADVGLFKHQALVVQRLQVILFVLKNRKTTILKHSKIIPNPIIVPALWSSYVKFVTGFSDCFPVKSSSQLKYRVIGEIITDLNNEGQLSWSIEIFSLRCAHKERLLYCEWWLVYSSKSFLLLGFQFIQMTNEKVE